MAKRRQPRAPAPEAVSAPVPATESAGTPDGYEWVPRGDGSRELFRNNVRVVDPVEIQRVKDAEKAATEAEK